MKLDGNNDQNAALTFSNPVRVLGSRAVLCPGLGYACFPLVKQLGERFITKPQGPGWGNGVIFHTGIL